ncbi:MAG: polysaccharide biosynthesis C-terminal domain-containing protein [Ilumatobacteraceae bacterium]
MHGLARGGTLNLIGGVGGSVLSMALVAFVARRLGADSAGLFFEAIALFNIAVVVCAFGADTGLLRWTSSARVNAAAGRIDPGLGIPGHASNLVVGIALIPVVVAGLTVGAAGYFFSGRLAAALVDGAQRSTLADQLAVMSVFVPIGAITVALLGTTRGYGTMVPTVVGERIGRPLVQLLAVGGAILAGASAPVVAGAWCLGVIVSFEVAALWLARLRPVPVRRGVRRRILLRNTMREFWGFTLPRAFAAISRIGVLWLDVLLVGAFLEPADAARYTVATRLLQVGFLAVDAVGQAAEPMFAQAVAESPRAGSVRRTRLNHLYQAASAWLVLLTWPGFILLAAFSPSLLGLFGGQYRSAWPVVVILAGSALVGSGAGPVDVLLVMAGRSASSLRNAVVSLVINVVANLILLPRIGIEGAAIAWAASRIVGNILPLVQVRRFLGVRPGGAPWWTAALLSVASAGTPSALALIVFGQRLGVGIGAGIVALVCHMSLAVVLRDKLALDQFGVALRRRSAREAR